MIGCCNHWCVYWHHPVVGQFVIGLCFGRVNLNFIIRFSSCPLLQLLTDGKDTLRSIWIFIIKQKMCNIKNTMLPLSLQKTESHRLDSSIKIGVSHNNLYPWFISFVLTLFFHWDKVHEGVHEVTWQGQKKKKKTSLLNIFVVSTSSSQ